MSAELPTLIVGPDVRNCQLYVRLLQEAGDRREFTVITRPEQARGLGPGRKVIDLGYFAHRSGEYHQRQREIRRYLDYAGAEFTYDDTDRLMGIDRPAV